MKTQRQAAILALVEREPIRSQEHLRARLEAVGFEATQATLSRDIKDLGLVKRAGDGAYQRTGRDAGNPATAVAAFERAVGTFVADVDQVQQLIVLRTGPGQAQPVAVAIDRAQLSEIVGTIAGDDTILVIVRDASRARSLRRRLASLAVR